MRPGAIESLNRRLATLEQMFVGQGIILKPFLDRALQETKSDLKQLSLIEQLEKLKSDYLRLGDSLNVPDVGRDQPPPTPSTLLPLTLDSSLLSSSVLDEIVNWYFDHIHPWIPILHVRFFRENLREPRKRQHFKIILDAIVSLCLRFLPGSLDGAQVREICLKCRHSVILQSMEKFSVESLQALVIVAFDIVSLS